MSCSNRTVAINKICELDASTAAAAPETDLSFYGEDVFNTKAIQKFLPKPIAEKLGIEKLLEKYPYEVSGGQKQRAAIARALITKPQLILADEPSGALDSKAADSLMNLFTTINQEGQTIVMVTHSVKAASSAKRVLFIKDGKVFHQLYRGNLTNEEMYERISDTLKILTTGGEEDE